MESCRVPALGSVAFAAPLDSPFNRPNSRSFRFDPDRCTPLLPSRRPRTGLVRSAMVESTGRPAPMGQRSQYRDSWFDRFCIDHLAKSMSQEIGKTTHREGYDALIDISRQLSKSKPPAEQREIVLKVLHKAFPLWLAHLLRTVLLPSKFAWEYYAFTTPLLFQWLVGPAEVRETEVNGVMQKSVVHIKKCRYLESSNCVGMCVNLCKIPSETFIKKEFGADLTMVPNFEDMSCDMIFGKVPPPLEEDPAMSQPCYKFLCATSLGRERDCPKVSP